MADPEAISGAKRRWTVGKVLTLVVMNLVLFVVFFEVGVRVMLAQDPEVFGKNLRPNLEEIVEQSPMEEHPYLAYAAKPGFHNPEGAKSQLSINEWGHRGPSRELRKPEDVYRIVCLGGSSTYGHTPSSDAKTWPAQLEHWINEINKDGQYTDKRVEVINGGLSGWSTFESTINLAFRMVEFEPDLVIVYHTINDMRCALYDPPLPAEQRRHTEITMDNRHWRAVWPKFVPSPGETLLENSMAYVVLRAKFTDYSERVDSLNSMAIVDYDPAATELYMRADVPERGFQNFERNLRTIHAIASEHGAEVIFASQGNDDADIMAGSAQSQLASMRRMTGILKDVAERKGAVYVDAKAKLEATAAEVGKDKIFTGEVHLTDQGAERLALIFTEAVLLGDHGFFD